MTKYDTNGIQSVAKYGTKIGHGLKSKMFKNVRLSAFAESFVNWYRAKPVLKLGNPCIPVGINLMPRI